MRHRALQPPTGTPRAADRAQGRQASTEPLAPIVLHALELYVGERINGPIFLNADATERLSYSTSYALIRRLAKRAGIASAARISPHSLRHSFATELLGSGVPLQDVQDAMGHADPRTTRAYDRSRHNLDRHPTYAMAAQLHRSASRASGDGAVIDSIGDHGQ
jgi:integrase